EAAIYRLEARHAARRNQIIAVLKEQEADVKVADLCRQRTFYRRSSSLEPEPIKVPFAVSHIGLGTPQIDNYCLQSTRYRHHHLSPLSIDITAHFPTCPKRFFRLSVFVQS